MIATRPQTRVASARRWVQRKMVRSPSLGQRAQQFPYPYGVFGIESGSTTNLTGATPREGDRLFAASPRATTPRTDTKGLAPPVKAAPPAASCPPFRPGSGASRASDNLACRFAIPVLLAPAQPTPSRLGPLFLLCFPDDHGVLPLPHALNGCCLSTSLGDAESHIGALY
jgi:hypothetical protein